MPFKQYRVVFFPCQVEGGPSLPPPRLAQVRVNNRQALIDFVGVGEKTELVTPGGIFVALVNPNFPINATVAAVCQNNSIESTLRGNVVLYKPDEEDDNLPANLTVEEVKAVMKLHQTIQAERKASSAKNKKQKKTQEAKPKAARARFVEVFKPQYLKSMGETKPSPEELAAAIQQAWEALSKEERAVYEDAYNAEMEAYLLNHPAPPKGPRTAHILYSTDHKVIGAAASAGFKALSEEEQNKYRKRALEEKERYHRQLEAYTKQCESKGIPIPDKVARAQKKKAESKPPGEEPSRKRTKQADRKKEVKKSQTDKADDKATVAENVVQPDQIQSDQIQPDQIQPEPALAQMDVQA